MDVLVTLVALGRVNNSKLGLKQKIKMITYETNNENNLWCLRNLKGRPKSTFRIPHKTK